MSFSFCSAHLFSSPLSTPLRVLTQSGGSRMAFLEKQILGLGKCISEKESTSISDQVLKLKVFNPGSHLIFFLFTRTQFPSFHRKMGIRHG